MAGDKKWGSGSRCPACDKTVYPNEQVFAADRKAWHKMCVNCSVRGCRWVLVINSWYSLGW